MTRRPKQTHGERKTMEFKVKGKAERQTMPHDDDDLLLHLIPGGRNNYEFVCDHDDESIAHIK